MTYLEAQIKHAELQALWWIAAASNGHAETRTAYKGFSDEPMTPEELRADAMETAQQHMHNLLELAEKL